MDRQGKYSHLITSDAGSVKEFAASQLKFSSEEKTVILLSGDGGVADLLNWGPAAGRSQTTTKTASNNVPTDASTGTKTLSKPKIALIPLGTGNALFHSLHQQAHEPAGEVRGAKEEAPSSPSPLVLALRTLLHGTARNLPAFRTTFSPGSRLIGVPLGEQGSGSGTFPSKEKEHDNDPNPTPAFSSSASPSPATITTARTVACYLPVPLQGLLGTIVTSYGFHASLVHASDTPSLRRFGARRFAMAAADLMKIGYECQAQVEYLPFLPPTTSSSPTSPPPSTAAAAAAAASAQQVQRNLPADNLENWEKIPQDRARICPSRTRLKHGAHI